GFSRCTLGATKLNGFPGQFRKIPKNSVLEASAAKMKRQLGAPWKEAAGARARNAVRGFKLNGGDTRRAWGRRPFKPQSVLHRGRARGFEPDLAQAGQAKGVIRIAGLQVLIYRRLV